jgi:hypothetical protein
VIDTKNKIKAILKFGDKSKGIFASKGRQDTIYGKIYYYKEEVNAPFWQK